MERGSLGDFGREGFPWAFWTINGRVPALPTHLGVQKIGGFQHFLGFQEKLIQLIWQARARWWFGVLGGFGDLFTIPLSMNPGWL